MSLELYDILAEDHEIWMKKTKDGQIEVNVFNEDDACVYHESSHPAAWESLVYFAKQVIAENERLEREHV